VCIKNKFQDVDLSRKLMIVRPLYIPSNLKISDDIGIFFLIEGALHVLGVTASAPISKA